MPRGVPNHKAATPGDAPKTQARVNEAAKADEQRSTPQVTAQATAPDGTSETVRPTNDTAAPHTPAKTTAPLRGDQAEQMAALMARMAALEQRNRDLEGQVRAKADPIEPAKPLPTLEKAMKLHEEAESAEDRRPILTKEGWLVHPHSFEQPTTAEFAKVLNKLATTA